MRPTVFRKDDFPSDGLGTKEALDAFFRPLNVSLAALQASTDASIKAGSNIELRTAIIKTPSDWQVPASLSNSWVPSSGFGIQYRKSSSGAVYLTGNIKSGTLNTTAFTVPPAFQPPQDVALATESNGAFATMRIGGISGGAPGAIVPVSGSNASFSLDCSWMAGDLSPYVQTCFPITCKTGVGKPSAVLLASLVDQTVQTAVAAPSGLHWKPFGSGQFQILNLPGLTPGRTYLATLLVFASM